MIIYTHLALGLASALLFISYIEKKFLFVFIVLFSTFIPDIDSGFSFLGKKKIFRPLQFFIRHRGIMHSFGIAVLFAVIVSFILPEIAFPFFLGYSVHILADSISREGVRPFWPLKYRVKGYIKVGGIYEMVLFVFLFIIDLILIYRQISF